MNRFLSRREKDGSTHRRNKSKDKSTEKKAQSLSGDGVISLFKTDAQKRDMDHSTKVQTIRHRMQKRGYDSIDEQQINYALDSMHSSGDVDKAFEMLLLLQESVEGIIKPYNPSIQMRGAVNRENVTCYLDALLFSMFARLGSFEPILYKTFEDEPRRRLSTLLRLWVNMLRTGNLIQTDLTQYLQEALAACGWEDAAKLRQQDTSEAFSFITETLELPLLTLKMDIFHHGAESATDDHRIVHERLLEVAVPEETSDSRPLRLEDCLEDHFNSRIEIHRQLERIDTRSSAKSEQLPSTEKGEAIHIETSILSHSSPNTPISPQTPSSPLSPGGSRHRATSMSIIRTRLIDEDEKKEGGADSDSVGTNRRVRKGSIRKEVLVPAWQFFNLIPWYTRNSPTTDAGVAAHFSQTRPVLGICLKRYGVDEETKKPYKRKTFIDIPLDIRLPHFVEDDTIPEDGPLVNNFKLSLQSIICHRGSSLNQGHYVSYIRGASQIVDGDARSPRKLSNANNPPHYSKEEWIRFDDLANPRVQVVEIEEALKTEAGDPYLLFFQAQPTNEITDQEGLPPSYSDAGVGMQVTQPSPQFSSNSGSHEQSYFDNSKGTSTPAIRLSSELERPPTPRRSINLTDDHFVSQTDDQRRGSIANTDASLASTVSVQATSAPVTPSDETAAQRMSRAAARFTKSASRSRPTSQSGESRLSGAFPRINWTRSKETLKTDTVKEIVIHTDGATESRTSMNLEEATPRIGRSKSKREKKREKSKGPVEKLDHHHHHLYKGKGKANELPDRECIIM